MVLKRQWLMFVGAILLFCMIHNIYAQAKEAPSNKGTREEQEEVLRILWNFSAEQEEKEEELYGNYDE